MTGATMSDAMCEEAVSLLLGEPVRLRIERDPSQPIGLPCPECGHRPAMRGSNPARNLTPGDDPFAAWFCGDCGREFTLTDVLRYLWNRKS